MKINIFKRKLKQKYSINKLEIVEGKVKPIPKLLWFYVQSTKNPRDFVIEIATEDRLFKSIGPYTGVLFKSSYITSALVDEKEKQLSYSNRKMPIKDFNIHYFDFAENCEIDDIYQYNDFIELSKAVMNEVYDLFELNNSDENMNYCIKEKITEEDVRAIIKKVHREYMDNKKSAKNENTKKMIKDKKREK